MPPAADASEVRLRTSVGASGHFGNLETSHRDNPPSEVEYSQPEGELPVEILSLTNATLGSVTKFVEKLKKGSRVVELLGNPAEKSDDLLESTTVHPEG